MIPSDMNIEMKQGKKSFAEFRPSAPAETDKVVMKSPQQIRELFHLHPEASQVTKLDKLTVLSSITKDLTDASDRPKTLTCSPQLSC